LLHVEIGKDFMLSVQIHSQLELLRVKS
jgi:hypothetical protein